MRELNQKKCKQYRKPKWLRSLFIFAILVLVIYCVYLLLQPPVTERIAAFDSVRAIPDSNNAALFYAEMLSEYKNPFVLSDFAVIPDKVLLEKIRQDLGLFDTSPDFLIKDKTYSQPWTRDEFPSIAAMLQEHAKYVSLLQKGAKQKECYFLLAGAKLNASVFYDHFCGHGSDSGWEPTYQRIVLDAIDKYRDSLLRFAYLDMGEGRLSEAIDKAEALIGLGRHLCQFPFVENLSLGRYTEINGLQVLMHLIIMGPSTILQLDDWQRDCQQAKQHWMPTARQVNKVMRLVHKEGKKRLNRGNENGSHGVQRNRFWLKFRRSPHTSKRYFKTRFMDLTSEYQRFYFLIELRRHKEKTGQWPTHFKQVKPELPPEVISVLQAAVFPILWFSPDCYILYGDLSEPTKSITDARYDMDELVVCAGGLFNASGADSVQRYVNHLVERFFHRNLLTNGLERVFYKLSGHSIPLLIESLQHRDSMVRTHAVLVLSRLGEKNVASLYDCPRELLLESLLSGYAQERKEKMKFRYIMAFQQFREMPESSHQRLTDHLRNTIRNGPIPFLRGAAAHVLLEVSERDGLLEILDHMERLSDIEYFGKNRHGIVWSALSRALKSYGFHEYRDRMDGDSVTYKASHRNLTLLDQWWQENRAKVIASEHRLN